MLIGLLLILKMVRLEYTILQLETGQEPWKALESQLKHTGYRV